MKILVPVKRVPDTDQRIVAAADGSGVAVEHIPCVINPFDAIALEEALRIGERGDEAVETIAVGVGGEGYEAQLRTALAMGAARAIHVSSDHALDPWSVARYLHAIVLREQPQLVLMGKQAVDDDANQTGQFLAALLDWPQATFASHLEVLGEEIRVDRETDSGIERLRVPLPAVVTVDLRLAEPRYASMAGILKAKKKPIEVVGEQELGIALQRRVQVLRYQSIQNDRRRERVSTVDELVKRLESAGAITNSSDANPGVLH
jgi:electron transfer flavoprotein beta subunit